MVSATVPAENEVLAALVEGSQRSWTGSGWPRHDGPSYYDSTTGVLHLRHTAEDYCTQSKNGTNEGVRAYLVDVLSSLACHVDVQASDGRGMLLRYVSGYVPKFSDAFTTEWLNDEASDYMVAKRVLTDYHPLEPEMALQLAMQWFPQCFLGGTMQRFRVPVPFETDKLHARVQQYLESTWRAKDMTLEEFLRKTNQKGSIHRTLQRRHMTALAAAGQEGLLEDTLEEWANQATMRGEVAIAAMYLSRYSDRYYGQWVLMKVPFLQLEELHDSKLDLVPDHLYYQAMALHHRPDHWRSEAAVRAELELEAFREYHVRNIWAMLQANHILIQDYFNGNLHKAEEAPAGGQAFPSGQAGEKPPLSRQQQLVVDELLASVALSYKRQAAKDEEWQGEGPEEPLFPDARLPHAFAVLGPAGSGKSTAVCEAVEKVASSGGRVLLTAPTGRLAATLREKFPNLEVDTMHGAFLLWKPVQETFEVMFPYDMIVVEEVGQVSRQNFERIVQQWEAADRLPTLVFVGDFCQLEGVDRSNALQSNVWHSAAVKKHRLNTMMRCKCPVLRKKLELLRTAKPSKAQLKAILTGHKAPSLKRAGYVMADEPSQDDVKHILEETPNTLFVTISRQACAKLNALAVEVLFEEAMPLAWVPGDPESKRRELRARSQGSRRAVAIAGTPWCPSHPDEEPEQSNWLCQRHGGNHRGDARRQCFCEDRPGKAARRASVDFARRTDRTTEGAFSHEIRLRLDVAQSARGNVATYHAVAGCGKHAGGGICRTQSCRIRRELALCGQSNKASLHASHVSLSASCSCVVPRMPLQPQQNMQKK